MNRLILIFISSMLMNSLLAQNNDRWSSGSAKQFIGEVVTLVCFISTPDNDWTDEEKSKAIAGIDEGNMWLMKQSEEYNVDLKISNYIINPEDDIKFDTIESGSGSGKERVDWIYQIVQKLGYRNSKQATKKFKKKYGDNVHMIVMAKMHGRPYAIRYARGLNKKKYFLEGLIIYNEYYPGVPIPIPAIYAHELLHIYGAWDLYKTYAQTGDRQAKATELYPNDIMLRVDHTLMNLNIDKLTAWLIGWNKQEEELFEWFRPSDYSK